MKAEKNIMLQQEIGDWLKNKAIYNRRHTEKSKGSGEGIIVTQLGY